MRRAIAGIFHFIARSIAALLAVLFILATILVLLLLNMDHVLLNAGTYKRALAANKVYEKLPGLLADQFEMLRNFLADPCAGDPLGCAIEGASPKLQGCLMQTLGPDAYEAIGSGKRGPSETELQASQSCLDQFGGGGSGPKPGNTLSGTGGPMTFINNLTPDDWRALVTSLLPAEDLRQMTETTLDQVFAYLNGRADTAKLSLVKLKARLAGGSGRDLVLLLMNAQPPCTEEQLATINAADFSAQGQAPIFCAATGAARDRLLGELQGQLDQAAARIPDEAVLIKPLSTTDPSAGSGPLGRDPVKALGILRLGIHLSPLLPVTLLLLVTLFGVRSIKSWLLWWGIPLFIAGLIALCLGIAALPGLNWAWTHYAAPRIPPMFSSSSLVSIGLDVLRFVVRDLANWITIESGLLAALGLGAIVGSFFVKPKPKPDAPAAPARAGA